MADRELDYSFGKDAGGNFVIRITAVHVDRVQNVAFSLSPQDASMFFAKGVASLGALMGDEADD